MSFECSSCGWSQPEQARACPKCGAKGRAAPFPLHPDGTSSAERAGLPAPSMQATRLPLLFAAIVALGGAAGAAWLALSRPATRPSETRLHEGAVVRTSGRAPVSSGARCSLRIEPASGRPYNCRLVVSCDGRTIYGDRATNGYAHCTLNDGVVTGAHESTPDDGDPDISYDAQGGTLVVKEPDWQVDIEL